MLLAVEGEEFQFPLQREATFLGGLAEFLSPFSSRGLFGNGARKPAFATPLSQQRGKGRFTGAINAFYGNEKTAWNGILQHGLSLGCKFLEPQGHSD